MDNSLWKMLLFAVVDRAMLAVAAGLVSDGLLQQSDVPSFEKIATGVVVGAVGLLVAWYREKGHVLVENDLKVANQRIAALSKSTPVVAK